MRGVAILAAFVASAAAWPSVEKRQTVSNPNTPPVTTKGNGMTDCYGPPPPLLLIEVQLSMQVISASTSVVWTTNLVLLAPVHQISRNQLNRADVLFRWLLCK